MDYEACRQMAQDQAAAEAQEGVRRPWWRCNIRGKVLLLPFLT